MSQEQTVQPYPNVGPKLVHVLIVDDDSDIRELLVSYLPRYGIATVAVGDGRHMREVLRDNHFDLIVLDRTLPEEDGFALCRWLRNESQIPIIMLTALAEPADRIVGLELGADDYMAKPFEPRELVARIQSVLRRVREDNEGKLGARIHFNGWLLDCSLRQLQSPDGLWLPLSNAEYRLLLVFLQRPRRVLSREQLLDAARGRAIEVFDRSIDLLISRLRHKLGDNPRAPCLIKTVRGEGYLFDVQHIY